MLGRDPGQRKQARGEGERAAWGRGLQGITGLGSGKWLVRDPSAGLEGRGCRRSQITESLRAPSRDAGFIQ